MYSNLLVLYQILTFPLQCSVWRDGRPLDREQCSPKQSHLPPRRIFTRKCHERGRGQFCRNSPSWNLASPSPNIIFTLRPWSRLLQLKGRGFPQRDQHNFKYEGTNYENRVWSWIMPWKQTRDSTDKELLQCDLWFEWKIIIWVLTMWWVQILKRQKKKSSSFRINQENVEKLSFYLWKMIGAIIYDFLALIRIINCVFEKWFVIYDWLENLRCSAAIIL